MPVKIAMKRLVDLMSFALAERSRALISPALYDFREDGVLFKQATQDKMLATWSRISKDFFEEYEPIGELMVAPSSIIAIIRDHFTHSPTLTLEKTEDKLVIRSEISRYEEPLLATDVERLEGVETRSYEDLVYPVREGYDLKALYNIDLSPFRKAKKSWELVRFEIGPEGVTYELDLGAGKLKNKLLVKPLIKPKNTYKLALPPDFLAMLSKVLSGPVRLGLVASDNEPGLLVFHTKTDLYVLNYWRIPEVTG